MHLSKEELNNICLGISKNKMSLFLSARKKSGAQRHITFSLKYYSTKKWPTHNVGAKQKDILTFNVGLIIPVEMKQKYLPS